MKCNLPKGFKASVREESLDQRPLQEDAREMFTDRRNMSLGAGQSHRIPQGTGKTYNFSRAARARRKEQEQRHNAVMGTSQMRESERNFQRRVERMNSDNDNSREM